MGRQPREDEEVFVADRKVIRMDPDEDQERGVRFLITVDANDTEVVAARLRATYLHTDVQSTPNGMITMYQGGYGHGWNGLTAIEVDEVVQDKRLIHLVLAPDPGVIDAIQMRANRPLDDQQVARLVGVGVSVEVIEVLGRHGYLYRLAPRVGNEWPSRDQIAGALDASHSSPQDPRRW